MSRALLGYGTAAEERSANLSVDGEVAPHFVLHADGNWSKSDDLQDRRSPADQGFAGGSGRQPLPRDPGPGRPQGRPCPTLRQRAGKLRWRPRLCRWPAQRRRLGTPTTTRSMEFRSAFRSIPLSSRKPRPSTSSRPATTPAPKSRSTGFFNQVRLRGGYANYRHDEIEDTGAIASTFYTKGGEGRAEICPDRTRRLGRHQRHPICRQRKVFIEGEEKFLPDSKQKPDRPVHHAKPSARPVADRGRRCGSNSASSTPKADVDLGTPAMSRDFTTFSGSLAAQPMNSRRLARRPDAVAQRPGALDRRAVRQRPACRHPGIRSRRPRPRSGKEPFGRGQLRKHSGPVKSPRRPITAASPTSSSRRRPGAIEDDLPVYQYLPGQGRLLRLRVRGRRRARRRARHPLGRRLRGRLCPRHGQGFRPCAADPAAPHAWRADRHAAGRSRPAGDRACLRQDRNAPLETETDGYTLVNASLDWHPLPDNQS